MSNQIKAQNLKDLYDLEVHGRIEWTWDTGFTGHITDIHGELLFSFHSDDIDAVIKALTEYAQGKVV